MFSCGEAWDTDCDRYLLQDAINRRLYKEFIHQLFIDRLLVKAKKSPVSKRDLPFGLHPLEKMQLP
ncbi:hypothetical protein [Nostoc sp.]|uniref:hypothetical protein n=1 Tax=Nostoc sp. TaxID=1180 RepID=UPI002FFC528F